MSAPLLTPLDSPIFDDDVISEMEEHLNDAAACETDECVRGAEVRAVARCCGRTTLLCTEHLHLARRSVEATLALCCIVGRPSSCLACGARFPAGTVFNEIYEVHPI
ncbi:hypothetical protein [Microbacterium sp. No. 7]|uniref:hypothetical protein n=1 Tax=Microbacterium sp. No. 7 TaxID=1714373 RepID=UPI0006D15EA0|nr:hypothetical protein [Microbacterium sp. No. 7]ALJ20395.1 hypothetical protein AOA12_10930 [Microbacterium sp. No. 7]